MFSMFLKQRLKHPFDNIIFAKYLVDRRFSDYDYNCIQENEDYLTMFNDNHFVTYVALSIMNNGCFDFHISMDLHEKIRQAFGFNCGNIKTFFKIRRYIKWALSRKNKFNWCAEVSSVLSDIGTKPKPKYNKLYIDSSIPFNYDWIIDWEALYNKYKDCIVSYPNLSSILNKEGTKILKKVEPPRIENKEPQKTTWKDEFEKYANVVYPSISDLYGLKDIEVSEEDGLNIIK